MGSGVPPAAHAVSAKEDKKVMQDALSSHPVVLNLRPAGSRTVDSAYETIEAMQDGWPDHSNHRRAYHRALRTCRDTLDGLQSGSSCRPRIVHPPRSCCRPGSVWIRILWPDGKPPRPWRNVTISEGVESRGLILDGRPHHLTTRTAA